MTPPPENPALARIQQNVLARSERRLLTWLCAHLPAWVTPDKLTVTGMVGAVAIFLGYALSTFSAEWLFLALAGYRSEERRVGKECVSRCRFRWSPYP